MKNIVLCLINVLLMATGQLLFKYGVKDKTINSFSAVVDVIFSPAVALGLITYACTTIFWLYILSRVPLNFAYPIQALAFPLVLVLAMFFFKEIIPVTRWIGVIIIFIGVIITVK